MNEPPSQPSTMLKVARVAAILAAGLGLLKYFVLAGIEGGIANAPHFFLLLPILLLAGAFTAARKTGLGLLMLMFLVLAAIAVSAIVNRGINQQNWADSLVVFGGLPLAVLGFIASILAFRDRPRGSSGG